MNNETIPEYLRPPQHEINADNFVRYINKEVARKYPGVHIDSTNFSKQLLQRNLSEAEKPLPGVDYELLVEALNSVDKHTPDFYMTETYIQHKNRDLMSKIENEVDEAAESHNGVKTEYRPLEKVEANPDEYWTLLFHTFTSSKT